MLLAMGSTQQVLHLSCYLLWRHEACDSGDSDDVVECDEFFVETEQGWDFNTIETERTVDDKSLQEDEFLFDHIWRTISHRQQLRHQILVNFLRILTIRQLDDHIAIRSISLQGLWPFKDEEYEFTQQFVEVVIETIDGDAGKYLTDNLTVDTQFS